MFYHVFARISFYNNIGDCDLESEDEVINGYFIPYLRGEVFIINGQKLVDTEISAGLQVFRTQEPINTLVMIAPRRHGNISVSKYRVLMDNFYAEDITLHIQKQTKQRIDGLKMSTSNPGNTSIHIEKSTINSPVTGSLVNSTQTITLNKSEIECWLRQITEELEKTGVRNEEMTDAIKTLQAALQVPKPSGIIIHAALEAVKTIGYGIASSAAWQELMKHPPIA